MEPMEETYDPPEGYTSLDCPNSPENKTLTCPYKHEYNWHKGPYICGECGHSFAAAPALDRHGRASGHQVEWECRDDECEKFREKFATSALYLEHLRDSSSHGCGEGSDEAKNATSAFSPSTNSATQDTEDDIFGPSVQIASSNGNICNEPCCYRYGTDYRYKSKFNRHEDTGTHQIASRLSQVLLANTPADEVGAEQEAIRALRCNWSDCLLFGKTFKNARGFYRHLQEEDHRNGWDIKFQEDSFEYNSDNEPLPGISFYVDGRKGMCVNNKCPRVGMKFDSFTAMKQHSRSFDHSLTEEDLASTDAEESGDEIWKTSDVYGMEVTEDEGLWKCAKQGCKGYQKIMSNMANVRMHFNSAAHLNAADEVNSSDDTHEELDGMEFSKDSGWLCVRPGCKKLGTTYRILYNAKRHFSSEIHVMAEEESSDGESEEELDGVAYSEELAAWVCTKNACKRYGHRFAYVGFARQHARCTSHLKAGEITATPRRIKHYSIDSPLTPIEMDGSTIHVTPGSPSAGRGLNLVRRPAGISENSPATRAPGKIRIRRSSGANSRNEKRIVELEKENQQLKERVTKLEGEVFGPKSPSGPQSGLLAPLAAQVSNASSSSLSSPTSSRQMENLAQYVQDEFRLDVPMEVDESDDMRNPAKY
ncbi:hypothetical protein FVEN_g7460 [Fusarium venenatum]|uniref:C2H2-type domain-containing protein n=1 Tax=Fusarium venenatum TaxID=56646 RepID=A0A2L2TMK8_9HYPO|nr:uncharacterized protein FVRRES_02379 [Fusarium venenatum]KAG8354673.1 hypothetical protein FVEN_g7460 [Fusarium venenatum]CEI65867.1 unnamed protein product [Fusarium venenatum]